MKTFGCPHGRAVLIALLLSGAVRESKAELIIDTGPGENSGGGVSLYTFPDNQGFQWIAGQFSITRNATLTGAQGWIANDNTTAGSIDLSLARNNAGRPGEVLFAETFVVPVAHTANWFGVTDAQWRVAAGTYWITFAAQERPVGSTMAMPGSAPFPLEKTAEWNPENSESWESGGTSYGLRVYGDFSPVPEPALFGLSASALLAGLAVWRRRAAALSRQRHN